MWMEGMWGEYMVIVDVESDVRGSNVFVGDLDGE